MMRRSVRVFVAVGLPHHWVQQKQDAFNLLLSRAWWEGSPAAKILIKEQPKVQTKKTKKTWPVNSVRKVSLVLL